MNRYEECISGQQWPSASQSQPHPGLLIHAGILFTLWMLVPHSVWPLWADPGKWRHSDSDKQEYLNHLYALADLRDRGYILTCTDFCSKWTWATLDLEEDEANSWFSNCLFTLARPPGSEQASDSSIICEQRTDHITFYDKKKTNIWPRSDDHSPRWGC